MTAARSPGSAASASGPTRFIIAAVGVLSLFGAAVQYNDSDQIRWAAIYLAAAAVSFAALRAPGGWIPAAAPCAVASIWALALAPAATRTSLPALFETWEMMDANVEEGRELGGLLLIAIWSAVLAARGRRIANRAASRPGR